MMNAAAGIFLAARRKPRLPYDAEVEYLESTGTQYIDTAIIGTEGMSYYLDAQTTRSGTMAIFGFMGNSWVSNGRALYQFLSYAEWECGKSVIIGTGSTNRRKYSIAETSAIVDGVTYNYEPAGGVTNSRSVGLYCCIRSTASSLSKMRCWCFRIIDSLGHTLRDFIPVRFTNELGQSEGAMYDRANPTVGMNPDLSLIHI